MKSKISALISLAILISISASFVSADVILHPGYINGTLSVGSETVTGGYVSASDTTNTYAAYGSAPNGVYSLTVEGGYTYDVYATAYMGNNQLSIGKQTISVNQNETVTLDFSVNPGYINGSITATGGTLQNYYLYANYYDSGAGQYYNAYSSYGASADGTFNFPMVPGTNVEVSGYAYVDGIRYQLEYRYVNVSAGQTIDVYYTLNITPGSISGNVSVEGETINQAYVYGYSCTGGYKDASTVVSPNGSYLLGVAPGTWTVYPDIYMNKNYLRPPSASVNVSSGENVTGVDFIINPGYANGTIELTGANTDIYSAQIRAYGSNNTYAYVATSTDSYGLILSPGDWQIGHYQYLYFDYPDDPNPYLYSHLQIVNYSLPTTTITQDETVSGIDFSYGTAMITTYFYVEGGGSLKSPEIRGSYYAYPMNVWGNGYGSSLETTIGEVTITVTPGTYNLEAWAYVGGSRTKFGEFMITVEEGDIVDVDIGAPDLALTAPGGGACIEGSNVTVEGTATDDTGIANVTVNGNLVTLTSTNNPDDPNEVSFNATVDLAIGENTITVVATDLHGKTATIERSVYRDEANPTLEVISPENGSITSEDNVTVTGTATDDNAIDTVTVNGVKVTVDPNNGSFSYELTLVDGENTITVIATDLCGKTATDTRIVTKSVNSPPVADADGPYTGVVGEPITFNGTGSYDPDGTIVSYEWDLDDDGEFDDANGPTPTMTWDAPYSGNISLRVTDNDGATDIDSTTLTVKEVIPATIDFDPDTLNKKSKGKWVTVYTELPAGYNVTDINVSTMMLNETVPAELQPTEVGDYDSDGIPDLMVKFDRQAVSDILQIGDTVDIAVTGKLYNGASFGGSDTIRVLNEGKGK